MRVCLVCQSGGGARGYGSWGWRRFSWGGTGSCGAKRFPGVNQHTLLTDEFLILLIVLFLFSMAWRKILIVSGWNSLHQNYLEFQDTKNACRHFLHFSMDYTFPVMFTWLWNFSLSLSVLSSFFSCQKQQQQQILCSTENCEPKKLLLNSTLVTAFCRHFICIVSY